MAEKHEYVVNRAMQGDKSYNRGDVRSLTEADAAGLLATGALTKKGGKPVEREPLVRHTFGAEPTDYTTYTAADTGKPSVAIADRREATQAAATPSAKRKGK